MIAIAEGMQGYLARPSRPNGAGVVVIQEIFGINPVVRAVADRLAAEGHVALAPDLFWRLEPGVDITDKSEAEWKKALDLMNRFDIKAGVEDVQTAITTLRTMPGVKKVGVVGYCLGGLLAYLAAARTDADASVGYYGVNIQNYLSEAPWIDKPLMLHIAAKDGFVPKEAQAQILDGLAEFPLVTCHVYPGVDHAFARPGGQHFDQAAAALANDRTAAFFRRHLA